MEDDMSLTKRQWRFAAASLIVPVVLQAILLSLGEMLYFKMPGYGASPWIWISCATGVVLLAAAFRVYAIGIALVYVPAMAVVLFWLSLWFLGLGVGPATPMRIEVR
jgi:hypothetical protein